MNQRAKTTQKIFFGYMFTISCLILISAFYFRDSDMWMGFQKILTTHTGLTIDFFAVGGLSATLLNVSMAGFLSLFVFWISKAEASGLGLMAFFIMLGFSFFGKTVLNSIPIILGTFLYSKLHKLPFRQVAPIALFACSLAPAVTMFAFAERHLTLSSMVRYPLSLLVGLLVGFLIPIISRHTPNMHKGMNIYNVGLSGGLVAWMLYTLYRNLVLAPAGGANESILQSKFSSGLPYEMTLVLAILFFATALWGAFSAQVLHDSYTSYRNLWLRSGHQCDFVKTDGISVTLLNMSMIGIFGTIYYHVVKAPFTGPTIGALLSMVCLSANGVTLRNAWPLIAGYILASWMMPWGLGTQVIAVTVSFSFALSPITGIYGWYWGIIAGFLHASLAPFTSAIHGGLTLYNGGFSAGLVALFLVPILEATKKPERQ